MNVSIIIPCFNEEKTISDIIHSVKNNINDNDEIIVIDDYSTDKTRNILEVDLKSKIDNLILNEKNFGKGYSIRKGIERSKGDIILIQDADLEYDPSDYQRLLKPIRMKQIGKYINRGDVYFPNNIVVNIENPKESFDFLIVQPCSKAFVKNNIF